MIADADAEGEGFGLRGWSGKPADFIWDCMASRGR